MPVRNKKEHSREICRVLPTDMLVDVQQQVDGGPPLGEPNYVNLDCTMDYGGTIIDVMLVLV